MPLTLEPAASDESDSASQTSQEAALLPDNSSGRSRWPPRCVTFCAIQLEIADGSPDVDIHFNRGKSLEDVFHSLSLTPALAAKDPEGVMSGRRRSRGRRTPAEVTVTTFQRGKPDGAEADEDEAAQPSVTSVSSSNVDQTGEKSKSNSGATSKESTPSSSARTDENSLNFVSGNPFVEVTKGVIHLYKENQATSLEEGVIRSQMLCMLGVPAKLKTPDLLQFTAPCHSQLDMMRILQDGSPNQFMVLLRFRCQEAADEFYQAFNGQGFNSLEADVCSLVYVSKVETCKESEYYPMAGHTELPVCSICLERMDESISTVLTILCNHTFHGSCLAQWEDSTCPVCRYVQTPEVVADQFCSECKSNDDLWICLICGYIGCGRYVGGHSHAHFLDTHHCYTMELGANRVWDYVGDNFVHRLMQTDSADGKLVEAEGGGGHGGLRSIQDGSGGGEGGGQSEKKCVDGVAVNADEKLDSIQLEYTYLLTSQLEAQRRYYDEKLAQVEERFTQELEEMAIRTKQCTEEAKENEANLNNALKDKAKIEQKVNALHARATKLAADLAEERQMNESLRQNQHEWQEKVRVLQEEKESKDKEIGDLKEQLRDVMVFLDAQQSIATSPLKEEMQGGSITVGAAASESGAAARRKKKRGGR